VQASLLAPVTDALAQLTELSKLPDEVPTVPVPLSDMARSPVFAASLRMSICPVADPAAVGAKLTLNVSVAPAGNVAGRFALEFAVKECPETVTCEIVSDDTPVFDRVILALLDWPTVTVPKLTVVGDAEISPVAEESSAAGELLHPENRTEIAPATSSRNSVSRPRQLPANRRIESFRPRTGHSLEPPSRARSVWISVGALPIVLYNCFTLDIP
jgi:hypothetical protein